MNKSKKGGNKRLRNDDNEPQQVKAKIDVHELLREVRETEDIDRLIELTRSESEQVRLKASQQMCPCRVKTDQPDFWERIFELAEDPSATIRYQVLHNMCDGSPDGYEDKVLQCLEIFNRDPDKDIRRRAHKVLGSYLHTGKWNVL